MPTRDFTFAHLADAHVGAWPRDPAVRDALRESVVRALRVVEERECEFLLISGDLFHTPVPDPAEVAPVAAALRALSDQGRRIYVIYGSHDYVAHRTGWLDVLAETGLFLKSAPEAVRPEGDRWTLPFRIDPGTGARIAGISGRSQGLDRGSFLAVDSESFRAEPGFKIFQFHAAVQEYLPESLREHVRGISKEDLPAGCDYYAGGHIHTTYEGTGPEDRGLLVNPGAVFGTSITDIENGVRGRSRQGIVIVEVRDGIPRAEPVGTAPKAVAVFDVDVGGESVDGARARIEREIAARSTPGALLFPRIHGTLIDGTIGTLGLHRSDGAPSASGPASIHWDVTDAQGGSPGDPEPPGTADDVEAEIVRRLASEAPASLSPTDSPTTVLAELLRELGLGPGEGESKTDYELQRMRAARRLLKVPERDAP